MTFEELEIREDLLHAIKDMGFEKPMPVQEKVIPHLLHEDGDVVALAQTGTGKTAAFGLPVIQRTDTSLRQPQALIISPTRELCLQIGGDLADFSNTLPVSVCCRFMAARASRAKSARCARVCRLSLPHLGDCST